MSIYSGTSTESGTWELRLYVAGQSSKSLRAYNNLTTLCERNLSGRYVIEVVDLVVEPALARQDDIVAIPTLICRSPGPARRIIGDLSNTDKVLRGLQIELVES